MKLNVVPFPSTSVALLTMLVLWCASTPASAGTNGFLVPPFRGGALAEAGYWETFSVAIGEPGNGPDRAGATTGARLTQSETNAFLTGSGNIYNLSGASEFLLTDETPFELGTVVLQTRTLGSEIDYATVVLSFTDATGTHALAPLPRAELQRGNQPGLGATVSSLWQWNLAGLGVTHYTIRFRASAASMSFDALTLDAGADFVPLFTTPFAVNDTLPAIERWMYANNAAPCDRPAGSVFATFGDDAGVDTRHAQHLLGWDTETLVPPGRGAARYAVQRCRVTLTINRGNLFRYDPTPDALETFFATNQAGYLPDADAGRPVELFGVAFRNGFDAVTFDQCAPFGSNATGRRNAYAAGWSTNGELVDVGNNVGKTNSEFAPFPVAAFSIGQVTNVAPGELVPSGSKVVFDLNLGDPLVLAYVQAGLEAGRLRFMVSSLQASGGQFGAPSYPDFATHFNEAVIEPTRIEIEGVVLGEGDRDVDGLSDDWELLALRSLTHLAGGDADGDGLSNRAEYLAGTDPLDAVSVLRLAAVALSPAGPVTVRMVHSASRRYALEFTEDFSTWRPLTNVPTYEPGTNIMQWKDESAPLVPRFYRARIE